MNENNFPSAVEALFKGMNTVISSKTVVGEPTQIGDTIILPLVDVSFALGAGSTTGEKKDGSCGGLGGKMTPSAVLIIKDGYSKLVNIKKQDSMTKILDMIPDLVDRFTKPKNGADIQDEDAVEIAFPEKNGKQENDK